MAVMVDRVNLLYYLVCNLLILKSIFVFFFKECTICSDSDIHYIDESLQGLWYDHLKECKNKPGYQLLSTKNPYQYQKG